MNGATVAYPLDQLLDLIVGAVLCTTGVMMPSSPEWTVLSKKGVRLKRVVLAKKIALEWKWT